MEIEELRTKVAELTDELEKTKQEHQTAIETINKLGEEKLKLSRLNAELYARTVAGEQAIKELEVVKSKKELTDEDVAKSVLEKLIK